MANALAFNSFWLAGDVAKCVTESQGFEIGSDYQVAHSLDRDGNLWLFDEHGKLRCRDPLDFSFIRRPMGLVDNCVLF